MMEVLFRFPKITRLIVTVAFLLLGFWFAHLLTSIYDGPNKPFLFGIKTDEASVPKVALFAAVSAAAGWITTAAFSRANSVKQHTMTVLTQVRMSAEMNARIKCLFGKFRHGVNVQSVDITPEGKNEDWFNAAIYILNYYEFLAAAVRHRDLHEPLLRDCIRSQFLQYYVKLDAVIKDAIQTDPPVRAGRCTEADSRIYKEIRRLRDEWSI